MYIYKTTNNVNGLIYVGQSSFAINETTDYLGSGKLLKEAIKKYGKEVFSKEILQECSDYDELNSAEIYWIDFYGARNPLIGYNILKGGTYPNVGSIISEALNTSEELEKAIHTKVGEKAKARMAAGFCWKWSDPDVSGNLLDDVVIGDWKRPWDAKPGATRLAKGIPPAALWAYDPNGIGQIGCVYTAQGFEFDYIGVIIGKDLIYRNGQGWVGVKEESCDSVVKRSKEKFVDLVKNTYRVLLTRGMKVT